MREFTMNQSSNKADSSISEKTDNWIYSGVKSNYCMLKHVIGNLSFISWKNLSVSVLLSHNLFFAHFFSLQFAVRISMFLELFTFSHMTILWKSVSAHHTRFPFCLPNLDCKLWTSICSLARIWRAPQSRVCDIKTNYISIFF